jgi:hypothetical protein
VAKRKLNGRNVYDKATLLMSGRLNLSTQVLMSTRKGGLRAGYMNKLARQQKRTVGQDRSESAGPRVKDWMLGY